MFALPVCLLFELEYKHLSFWKPDSVFLRLLAYIVTDDWNKNNELGGRQAPHHPAERMAFGTLCGGVPVCSHLVSWSDAMINACFQMGLNDDHLFQFPSPGNCYRLQTYNFINYVLYLNGLDFFIDVAEDNQNHYSVPIQKCVGAPAHPQPAPSTYLSSGSIPSCPPMFS